MVLGSPFSFPFPRLVPFGGAFHSNRLLRAKTAGAGGCNLSSKDENEVETVEASDTIPSEVPISRLEWSSSDSEALASSATTSTGSVAIELKKMDVP